MTELEKLKATMSDEMMACYLQSLHLKLLDQVQTGKKARLAINELTALTIVMMEYWDKSVDESVQNVVEALEERQEEFRKKYEDSHWDIR